MDAVIERKSLIQHLELIEDPRMNRTKKHKLVDVILIAICAVIAGADGWQDIEFWAKEKKDWLNLFLELPNGIPSHDTIEDVFARISPKQFSHAFMDWISSLNLLINNEVVSIDGKTLRRSYDRARNKKPLHLVSAWATSAKITLGQIKTDEKSNEITAIPELLKLLDIKGCIITIDAIGCQKEIAAQIIDQNADYMLALKKNHKDLYEEVECIFRAGEDSNYEDIQCFKKKR